MMKKTFRINVSDGFTLLETLVAISIAATVGVLITQVFFTTVKSNTKTEILKEVKQNGDFALAIMERMIRNAYSVVSTCTAGTTTSDSIQIRNPDGTTTTFGCAFDSSVARIASTSGTGVTTYLTSNGVTLGGTSCAAADNSLEFTCTRIADFSSRIGISFTLNQKGAAASQQESASVTFQATVSPRN